MIVLFDISIIEVKVYVSPVLSSSVHILVYIYIYIYIYIYTHTHNLLNSNPAQRYLSEIYIT